MSRFIVLFRAPANTPTPKCGLCICIYTQLAIIIIIISTKLLETNVQQMVIHRMCAHTLRSNMVAGGFGNYPTTLRCAQHHCFNPWSNQVD